VKIIEDNIHTRYLISLLNIKQTHQNTSLDGLLTNIRASLEDPQCPSTVVHTFLNIILKSAALANNLLRWPTNMNKRLNI